MSTRNPVRPLFLIAMVGAFSPRTACGQSITDIGVLPGDSVSEKATVSDDGMTVVGVSDSSDYQSRAFRWTRAGGMQSLGTLPGADYSWASGTSANGSVVVGSSGGAFRWTAAGGMVSLGSLPGHLESYGSDVSADGTTVVGSSHPSDWQLERAFRWTAAGGMKSLGTLSGNSASFAEATSSDGAVVVGGCYGGTTNPRAFRWTAAGGMKDIGSLPGAYGTSANDVSPDGLTVVGSCGGDQQRAFRWTSAAGMQELLPPPGFVGAEASAVSIGATVIVGEAERQTSDGDWPTYDDEAVIWRTGIGAITLRSYLLGMGVSLSAWQDLKEASSVSANGRYVVGFGRKSNGDERAFIADLGTVVPTVPPPTGVSASDGTGTGSVTVKWNAVSGSSSYRIFRAVGNGAPVQVGARAPYYNTFDDASATPGVEYRYSVRSINSSGVGVGHDGDIGWRNIAAPTGTSATDGTSTANVTVTWNAATGATGYKVFRAVGSAAAAQVGTTTAAVRTFADTTAVPGTVYSYSVKATTAAGDSAASAVNTGFRAVSAPAGVAATDGTSTANVTVTWSAATGATGYKVFRGTGTAAPTTQVGTTATAVLTYADATAVAGTLYNYAVKAASAAGDGAASAANTGYRSVTAVTGVNASDGTFTTHVAITWTAHSSTAVTGYRVLRKIGTAAETTLTNVTGRTTVSFNDTTIPVGSTGTYRVAALTAAGPCLPSATNTGFRKSTGAMPTGGGSGSGDGGGAASDQQTAGSGGGDPLAGFSAPGSGGLSDRTWTPVAGLRASSAAGTEPWVPANCELVLARLRAMRERATDGTQTSIVDELLAPAREPGIPPAAATDAAPAPGAAMAPADCVACRMLRGDLNLDGRTGAEDMLAWVDAWSRGDWATGDLDRDGWIDGRDLAVVLERASGTDP